MGTDSDAVRFVRFVEQVRPRLRQTAYLMCGDWHLADDLAQETIVKVFRRWHRLETGRELGAYGYRVLVNAVRREMRRARRRHEILVAPPDLPSAASAADLLEIRDLVLRALTRLGPRQRMIVVLRYWEDQSVESTADIVGCSAATVRSQASRALETMRRHLGPILSSGSVETESE